MSSLEWQRRFALGIRDASTSSLPPGVSPDRMAIYRSLFHANIEGLLSGGFPVLRRVLGEARWQSLVRAFVLGHRSTTPYFHQLGRVFIDWLQQGRDPEPDDPPFLLELAHYERVELELEIGEAELPHGGWSALAIPLAYVWPVHLISADYRPSAQPEQSTCLLAWRDRSERVRFMELSPFAYRLALRLRAGETGAAAISALAAEAGLDAQDDYLDGARRLLESWRQHDIYMPGEDP